MAKLSAETREKIRALQDRFPHPRSAVMPALHYAQAEVGYLDDETLLEIAEVLGVPPNMTTEVVGFYCMFDAKKPGKYKLEVCRNLSCALRGSEEMTRQIEEKLGIKRGQTTADGKFTLMEVECLGACGYAPMMAIGPYYYENLTRQDVAGILDALAKDEEPPVRPAGFLDRDFEGGKLPVEHPVPIASQAIRDHLAVWGDQVAGQAAPAAEKEGGE